MPRVPATVTLSEPLSPTVRRLVLSVEGDFAAEPGQGLYVEAKRGDVVARAPYSIASAPHERGARAVEIAVAEDRSLDREASAATTIGALRAGDVVTVEGPAGRFTRSPAEREAPNLFVAGGTGLSPLRAMLAAELAARAAAGPPLFLVYGARSAAELLWRGDLEAFSASGPRFSWTGALSREGAPPGDAVLRAGRVTAHLDEPVARLGPDLVAFVCGPPSLVTDVVAALSKRGLPKVRIRTEW